MNYDVFDPFLARETWHTSHLLDDKAFYCCLYDVVDLPDFSPETMGKYMRSAKKIADDHPFVEDVRRLVSKAWTVRDFLAANR
jgi:hypothetical protein